MAAEIIDIRGAANLPRKPTLTDAARADHIHRAFEVIGIASDRAWAIRFLEALRASGADIVSLPHGLTQ